MSTTTGPPQQAPSDETQLRLAIQNLACHAQAQRRYAQMGWLAQSVANLQRVAPNLDALIEEGMLDAETAADVREISEMVSGVLERRPDLLAEEKLSPRDYLFSDALEEDDWDAMRHKARDLHSRLSGGLWVFVPDGVKRSPGTD